MKDSSQLSIKKTLASKNSFFSFFRIQALICNKGVWIHLFTGINIHENVGRAYENNL